MDPVWDVFMSFRAIDTRIRFTSHLYSDLSRNGIRTFMDDPELRSGEVISDALLSAIKNSRIYLVVLSQNYASSTWCLDELVEILKCVKELKRLVIPVFYRIDPSVVRHQTGSFQVAFEKHEIRLADRMNMLSNWRSALKEVADFSGYHVSPTRFDADIITRIVDEVLQKINFRRLHVCKYPVGIDSRVADVTSLLTIDTQGAHYIGIWGMGGVGKTTLAKAVFNTISPKFEGSCFFENVAEVFGQGGARHGLQKQLIADVLKTRRIAIDNVYQGAEMIRHRICSKKILIVVDNLNDPEHLDALVPGSFAHGSVIIITTRHEDLLDRVGVEARYRYMLKELGDAQSRQLFFKHAFGDENPSHEFVELSKEILPLAGGLPLAITIFGSLLCRESERDWKHLIGHTKESLRNVYESLMISFNLLVDPAVKEMFLDLACFFVGEFRHHVGRILGSSYKNVDQNIDLLRKRCLISFNENNQLLMHNLVSEMGRDIAGQYYRKDLRSHSRFSDWEDIYNVLKNHEGTEAIQGMVHHYNLFEVVECNKLTVHAQTFKRMPELRFLKISHLNLMGSFENAFNNLTWLDWSHCPLQSLPSDFFPEKLVILELRESNIRVWEQTRDLKTIKILDLSRSEELTTTPDFSRLPCLETINLHGCTKLDKVDSTIGTLVNLVSLDLSYCESLRSLPDSICNLTALKSLSIRKCYNLGALPEELGNISSLIELEVSSRNISLLPNSIGCLTNLVKLRLDENENLETLPGTICNMRSLEILDIRWCKKLDISQLSSRPLPPGLKELRGSHCRSMLRLPHLSNLKQLDILSLSYCSSLGEIGGLEAVTSIRYLNLEGCSSLKALPNLSNLKLLETLNLSYCISLSEIKGLEKLISIREVYLEGCDSTMLEIALTKSLIQTYSEFDNETRIYLKREDTPKWISDSSSRSIKVRINVPHKFLGLLLSLACPAGGNANGKYVYTIKNIGNSLTYRNFVFRREGRVMIVVPIKELIETCGDCYEDTVFDVTAWNPSHKKGVKLGVHSLYKP